MSKTPTYVDPHAPVYGTPREKAYGQTIAGLWFESVAQANVLLRVLERGMVEFAGRPEETFLAKVHVDVTRTKAKAIQENWAGWNDE